MQVLSPTSRAGRWAQVHGAKLVSAEDKEKLDEWYIRNASFGTDMLIIMKTLSVVLNNRSSSQEAVADFQQVQSRNIDLTRVATNDDVVPERQLPAA